MTKPPTNYVNVMVRIKPRADETAPKSYEIISQEPPLLLLLEKAQSYHFDCIFDENVNQEAVYDATVRPLVDQVKAGYNCTVFAYGQTGTGKTYTMGTSINVSYDTQWGIIPRTLSDFFAIGDDDTEVEISVSFMEIYNEKIFDLLVANQKCPLAVKGFNVPDLKKERVYGLSDARELLFIGNRNRHTGETRQNISSSRSHAVFTIHCRVKSIDSETVAKLNLVDLAGSESVRKTGNEGGRFLEGVNINKGLLSIGQVMTALSTNSNHVPYRESIITTILQDSLNKRNFITLIACMSPAPDDTSETQQTLKFSQQVKKIRNNPEINEIIAQYRREHPSLFSNSNSLQTPMKRSINPIVDDTPYSALMKNKKLKTVVQPTPLRTIQEPNSTACYAENSTLPSFSASMSTITTSFGGGMPQQTFSPVIRKYMGQMEVSLMSKLEDVILKTVQRPTQAAPRRSIRLQEKENAGTPNLPWDKIRNELTKIVRKEVAQASAARSTLATSSPFGSQESTFCGTNNEQEEEQINSSLDKLLPIARKLFETSSCSGNRNDSLESATEGIPSSPSTDTPKKEEFELSPPPPPPPPQKEDTVFKIPERPVPKKLPTKKEKANDSFSGKSLKTPTRQSTRTSLRLQNKPNRSSLMGCSSATCCATSSTRKRKSTSRAITERTETDLRRKSARLTLASNDDAQKSQSPERISPNNKAVKTKTKVTKTAVKKSTKKSDLGMDSPMTARMKSVLELLNTGNAKDLQELQTVGVKTSKMIIVHRQIRGRFSKISDLVEMPQWRGNKYKKFMEQNYLTT